jgi:hypothetical protein
VWILAAAGQLLGGGWSEQPCCVPAPMKIFMVTLGAMVVAVAAMEGDTCDDLPPLTPRGGVWESVEQHQRRVDTAEQCCLAAQAAAAWTFYAGRMPGKQCYKRHV